MIRRTQDRFTMVVILILLVMLAYQIHPDCGLCAEKIMLDLWGGQLQNFSDPSQEQLNFCRDPRQPLQQFDNATHPGNSDKQGSKSDQRSDNDGFWNQDGDQQSGQKDFQVVQQIPEFFAFSFKVFPLIAPQLLHASLNAYPRRAGIF